MFDKLRRIMAVLQSRDGKPVTYTGIIGRDDCSRTLTQFNDEELHDCQALIIVWRDMKGDVYAVSSDNVDEITASGMLGKAWSGVTNGHQ